MIGRGLRFETQTPELPVSGQLGISLIKGSPVPRPSAAQSECGQSPEGPNGRTKKEKYGPTVGVSRAGGILHATTTCLPSPTDFSQQVRANCVRRPTSSNVVYFPRVQAALVRLVRVVSEVGPWVHPAVEAAREGRVVCRCRFRWEAYPRRLYTEARSRAIKQR